jgi:hypothetical protein
MSKLQPFQARLKLNTHEKLKVVAKSKGVTMNALVEEYLTRELQTDLLLLEHDLSETLRALRQYQNSPAQIREDIRAYAQTEVSCEDPLQARYIPPLEPAIQQEEHDQPVSAEYGVAAVERSEAAGERREPALFR